MPLTDEKTALAARYFEGLQHFEFLTAWYTGSHMTIDLFTLLTALTGPVNLADMGSVHIAAPKTVN